MAQSEVTLLNCHAVESLPRGLGEGNGTVASRKTSESTSSSAPPAVGGSICAILAKSSTTSELRRNTGIAAALSPDREAISEDLQRAHALRAHHSTRPASWLKEKVGEPTNPREELRAWMDRCLYGRVLRVDVSCQRRATNASRSAANQMTREEAERLRQLLRDGKPADLADPSLLQRIGSAIVRAIHGPSKRNW
jgi:hypothetical protein